MGLSWDWGPLLQCMRPLSWPPGWVDSPSWGTQTGCSAGVWIPVLWQDGTRILCIAGRFLTIRECPHLRFLAALGHFESHRDDQWSSSAGATMEGVLNHLVMLQASRFPQLSWVLDTHMPGVNANSSGWWWDFLVETAKSAEQALFCFHYTSLLHDFLYILPI